MSTQYKSEFNGDLDGYVITFSSGEIAHTQFSMCSDRLHADYGERVLERFTEYDSELSDEQHNVADDFVSEINSITDGEKNEDREKH